MADLQGQTGPITPTGYEDLIKEVNLAIVQFTLYPIEHPLVAQALDSAFAKLTKTLAEKKEVTFGMIEERLLVEDKVLDKGDPSVLRFFNNFKKLKIDGLTFSEGVEQEEMTILLGVMAMKEDSIEVKGGVTVLLPAEKIPHMKVEKVRYERVTEGQVVVQVEDGEKVVKVAEEERLITEKEDRTKSLKRQKESFYKVMLKYLKGEVEDISAETDELELLKTLEKNPKQTATLLIEVGKEIQNLQLVVERLGNWLLDLVNRKGSEIKKDLSSTMASLGKKVQEEVLAAAGGNPEAIKSSEALGAVVSQYVEKIKTEIIVTKFQLSKRKSASSLKRIAAKVLDTKEERKNILPELYVKLKSLGISEEELNKAMESIKKVSLEDKKIEVSEAELKRLLAAEKKLKNDLMRKMAAEEEKAEAREEKREEKLDKPKKEPSREIPGRAGPELSENEEVVDKKELEDLRKVSEKAEQVISTRLKKATSHLREENKELHKEVNNTNAILKELSNGVVVVDNNNKVMLMNNAAEELLGIPKETMVGEHILEQLKSEHLLALARTGPQGDISSVEISGPDPSTKDTIKASSTIVQDENGRTVGMLFVLNDVTKQRELEKTKKEFITRVSSHIQDPFTTIRDSLLLLLDQTSGALNDEQKRLLNMAKESAESMDHSLKEILTLKEIKEEGLELKLVKFDIIPLIETCLIDFEKLAKEKKLSIETNLPKKIFEIKADKEKIMLVLNNLVANGVKATSRGGKVILGCESYTDEEQKDKEFVLISVEDTGRGIPETELSKVFEEFSDLGVKEERFSGLGVGLSIAKEIVSKHGGKIWVKSKWGQGSKFHFILPISK